MRVTRAEQCTDLYLLMDHAHLAEAAVEVRTTFVLLLTASHELVPTQIVPHDP